MTIKSDKWIIEQSKNNDLIKPFEASQIREVDGEKIVSYGVSSYGYDVRCANEFKIFTNTHSSIVDPKNFDEKSFIDLIADEVRLMGFRVINSDAEFVVFTQVLNFFSAVTVPVPLHLALA